jgi:hypothetical protein
MFISHHSFLHAAQVTHDLANAALVTDDDEAILFDPQIVHVSLFFRFSHTHLEDVQKI